MKISCNACLQRLGEIIQNSEEGKSALVAVELEAHLAQCSSCRSEVALLQQAREELRDFPVLAAPADLRARVRQQLEAAPTASTATEQAGVAGAAVNVAAVSAAGELGVAAVPLPANGVAAPVHDEQAAAPGKNENFKFIAPPYSDSVKAANALVLAPPIKETNSGPQHWNDKLRVFLRQPSNVAWLSGATICLFLFVALSYRLDVTPTAGIDTDDALTIAIGNETTLKTNEDAPDASVVAPRRTLPALPDIKRPQPPPVAVIPEAAKPKVDLQAPKPPPITLSESPLLAEATSPAANEPQRPQPKSATPARPAASQAGSGGAASGQSALRPAPTARPATPAAAAKSADSRPQLMAKADSSETTATGGAAGASAPPAPAALVRRPASAAAFGAAPRGSGATGAAGPAAAMESDAGRDTAARSMPAAERTAKLEVSNRITPPRNIGWAQVAVNLPAGVRFADGTRSRIVWRGSTQANEPVDFQFEVLAPSGRHQLRVSLQEVKGGEAQTVATKQVSVGGG